MGKRVNFKNGVFELLGREIIVGEMIPDFKVCDLDLNDVNSKQILAGGKINVVTCFPMVNGGFCNKQLKLLADLANELKMINFTAISLDLPMALKTWHLAENAPISLYSDYKTRDFGMKMGVLIDELFLLNRAVFVFSDQAKLLYKEIKDNNLEQINVEKLRQFLHENIGEK